MVSTNIYIYRTQLLIFFLLELWQNKKKKKRMKNILIVHRAPYTQVLRIDYKSQQQ